MNLQDFENELNIFLINVIKPSNLALIFFKSIGFHFILGWQTITCHTFKGCSFFLEILFLSHYFVLTKGYRFFVIRQKGNLTFYHAPAALWMKAWTLEVTGPALAH